MPDVVGGTRRLGCWQRHPPRRTKHVKCDFQIYFASNEKHTKSPTFSPALHEIQRIPTTAFIFLAVQL